MSSTIDRQLSGHWAKQQSTAPAKDSVARTAGIDGRTRGFLPIIAAIVPAIPVYSLAIIFLLCCVTFFAKLPDAWFTRQTASVPAIASLFAFPAIQLTVVLACFIWCRTSVQRVSIGALSYFVSLCLLIEPNQPGDRWFWIPHAQQASLWLSEPGANLCYFLFAKIGLLRVAPACFGVATYITLFYCDERSSGLIPNAKINFPWLTTLYLMSPISTMFAYNYVENAQLTMWLLLLANSMLGQFVFAKQSITLGSISLGLAAFVHGSAMFLMPMVMIAIVLRSLVERDTWRESFLHLRSGLGAYAVALFGPLLLARLMGFRLEFGNLSGGADKLLFVPLTSDSLSKFGRFTMFSVGNLSELSQVVFFGMPCLVFLVSLSLLRKRLRTSEARLRLAYFTSWVMGYLLFVFLWNFDLGFPADFDLMLAGSVIAIPCTGYLVTNLFTSTPHRIAAYSGAFVSWVPAWYTVASTVFSS